MRSLRTFAPHANTPRIRGSELDRFLATDGIWHLTTLDVSQNDLTEVDKLYITMDQGLGRVQVILE